MATIKEKAHEIGWKYSKHYDPAACRKEWCEMAAREGANYVLKCIEELIPNDEVLQNNVRCQSAIFRIQAIIGQLKK